MSRYRRPWWLLVNKPAGLVTRVEEKTGPGERVFILRGEPLLLGLAWLTWGPVAALVVVGVLAVLAVTLPVREVAWPIRTFFILAFLALPALAWAATSFIMTKLSAKPLQAERAAEAQEAIIRLNGQQGELSCQMTARPEAKKIAYHQIRQARAAFAIGERGEKATRLVLETGQGPVILLDETLGTAAQKEDLAHEIQEAVKTFMELNPQTQP